MTQETKEEEAVLACLTTLTRWFQGDREPNKDLMDQDPSEVVNFLLGITVSLIEALCEEVEMSPTEYMKDFAVHIQSELYQAP